MEADSNKEATHKKLQNIANKSKKNRNDQIFDNENNLGNLFIY